MKLICNIGYIYKKNIGIGIINTQRNQFQVSATVDKLLVKLTPLWSPQAQQSSSSCLYQIVEEPHITTLTSESTQSEISGPNTLLWYCTIVHTCHTIL